MVTTRGRHPAVPSQSSIVEHGSKMVGSGPRLEPATSNYDDLDNGENGTIGARLRKRRRTGSSPTESTPPAPRTTGLRKTIPPKSARLPDELAFQEASQDVQQDAPVQNAPESSPLPTTLSPLQRNATEAPIDNPIPSEPQMNVDTEQPQNGSDAHPHIPLKHRERLSYASVIPDLAAVITRIIDHGEHIDNHYAARGYDDMGMVDTESFLNLGASLHLKTQSLPILDNLATQILNTLAKSTYEEILTIATDPESDTGQAYAILKSLFDHTKKVYSITDPFLSPYLLGPNTEQAHIDTIRKANLATFVSSVFGSQDVGFYHLNEYFLDTFVADGSRLLKSQAQLFLDLKTQAYISALSHGERLREEILEDLFPVDLEERLLSRRPGAKQLAPSEADFLQRARNRSRALLEEPMTQEAIAALPAKYIWEDYLRDISAYVSKNFASIVGTPFRKPPRPGRSNFFVTDQQHQQHLQRQQPIQQNRQAEQEQYPQDVLRPSTEILNRQQSRAIFDTDDIAEKAARAAHFAMQGFGFDQGAPMPPQQQVLNQILQHRTPGETQQHVSGNVQEHHVPVQMQQQMQGQISQQVQIQGSQQLPSHPQQFQYHFEHQPAPPHYYQQAPVQPTQNLQNPMGHQNVNMNQHHAYGDQNVIPYPTQSAPTQVLYERARMAATAKASPSNRRAGHPSQRRPWTTDEENSLMAGLDRVKGPHWSQILAMFGPGGTINETLKDRNQVQLKDKARNLKLFFLKSGIEVPYYLQFVTGELKTRAPVQAMKNEQRDLSQAVEDRAHVEGVMTLAGGSLQDPEQVAGAIEDAVGDAEEGNLSMEIVEDDALHQNNDAPAGDLYVHAFPAGAQQQQTFTEPNEGAMHANGVMTDGEQDNGKGHAPPGYQVPLADSGPEAANINALDPI